MLKTKKNNLKSYHTVTTCGPIFWLIRYKSKEKYPKILEYKSI